jgi:hypothetical protein
LASDAGTNDDDHVAARAVPSAGGTGPGPTRSIDRAGALSAAGRAHRIVADGSSLERGAIFAAARRARRAVGRRLSIANPSRRAAVARAARASGPGGAVRTAHGRRRSRRTSSRRRRQRASTIITAPRGAAVGDRAGTDLARGIFAATEVGDCRRGRGRAPRRGGGWRADGPRAALPFRSPCARQTGAGDRRAAGKDADQADRGAAAITVDRHAAAAEITGAPRALPRGSARSGAASARPSGAGASCSARPAMSSAAGRPAISARPAVSSGSAIAPGSDAPRGAALAGTARPRTAVAARSVRRSRTTSAAGENQNRDRKQTQLQ